MGFISGEEGLKGPVVGDEKVESGARELEGDSESARECVANDGGGKCS